MKNKENTINQRIANLIDAMHQGSQAAFARQIKAKASVVADMLGEPHNKPDFEMLSKIAAAYPLIRTDWLLTGQGEMLKADVTEADLPQPVVFNYDQAEADERFLEEVYRLSHEGAFQTFSELAALLQAHRSIITEIQTGRYHCNLKLIYLLDAYFHVDLLYIVRGDGSEGRPKYPKPVVSAGRPPKAKKPKKAALPPSELPAKKKKSAAVDPAKVPMWQSVLYSYIGTEQHHEMTSEGHIKRLALDVMPLYEHENGAVEDQEEYFKMVKQAAQAYVATLPKRVPRAEAVQSNTDTSK